MYLGISLLQALCNSQGSTNHDTNLRSGSQVSSNLILSWLRISKTVTLFYLDARSSFCFTIVLDTSYFNLFKI
jgi:hypothetical protein